MAEGIGRGNGTGTGRCLPPDQRVLTPHGYRPIAEVDVRDAVITALGRSRLVIAIYCHEMEGPLYHLRTERGNLLRVRKSVV